jgi:hypothetical protein
LISGPDNDYAREIREALVGILLTSKATTPIHYRRSWDASVSTNTIPIASKNGKG